MNPIVTSIINANMRVEAKFARLNKNCTLEQYQDEIAKGPDAYRVEQYLITDTVFLSQVDYDFFAVNLLTYFDWFPCVGGFESDAPRLDGDFYTWPAEAQEAYKRHAYRLVFAVVAPERPMIYVDPQGYSYARYVGL